MEITVKNYQSLFDLAIEHSGSIEAVIDLAFDNNLSFTDDMQTASILSAASVLDEKTAELFGNLYNKPATALSRAEIRELCDAVGFNTADFGSFTPVFDDTFYKYENNAVEAPLVTYPYAISIDVESSKHAAEMNMDRYEIDIPDGVQYPDKVSFYMRQNKGLAEDNGLLTIFLKYVSTSGQTLSWKSGQFYMDSLPTSPVSSDLDPDYADIMANIPGFARLTGLIILCDSKGNGTIGPKNLGGANIKILITKD